MIAQERTCLQPVWGRFSNFLLSKLSQEFKLRRMSRFPEIQMAIFRYCVTIQSHGWACWSSYRYCACRYNIDPIQGQGQAHGASEFPKIAENCTFLGLSRPAFQRGAQKWRLIVIARDMVYSLSQPDFRISFMWVQTSGNVDIARISDGHISVWSTLTYWTRRPASADRTARRQFQATGQPVTPGFQHSVAVVPVP